MCQQECVAKPLPGDQSRQHHQRVSSSANVATRQGPGRGVDAFRRRAERAGTLAQKVRHRKQVCALCDPPKPGRIAADSGEITAMGARQHHATAPDAQQARHEAPGRAQHDGLRVHARQRRGAHPDALPLLPAAARHSDDPVRSPRICLKASLLHQDRDFSAIVDQSPRHVVDPGHATGAGRGKVTGHQQHALHVSTTRQRAAHTCSTGKSSMQA